MSQCQDGKWKNKKDNDGKVKTVVWEATGEGILPGQFQRFTFVAKNPDKEQKIALGCISTI